MKLRSFFSVLLAGVLVLLSIGSIGLYWILNQSPLSLMKGGITTNPTATMFVSKQAPVMVSVLVNPDRLEALRQFATPLKERRQANVEINQLKKSLLANTGLNYQKDIQPWLGDEITLAITSLDFDHNQENGVQPGYLLAVTTKDAELTREFLQASFSQQAIAGTSDLIFEQYKGVNLISKRSLKSESKNKMFATAVVGDFVLFANQTKVLKEAINNVQASNLSLKNSPSYQKALKTILEPRIGIAFVNLPALSAWSSNQPIPETPDIEQMLTVALSLKPGGLAAQTALIGVAGEETQPPTLVEPVEALKYLPTQSILTIAGEDLNQLWTQIVTGLEPDSPLGQILNQSLISLQTPLGLDLPQDIFSWVKEEYALSLLSSPKSKKLDWVFVAQKDPLVNPDTAIEHLDSLAREQGLSVGNFPLQNTTITAWTKLGTAARKSLFSLDAQVKGAHTTVGEYEIFATSIESLSQAIKEEDGSLLDNKEFQINIASLPTENDGYLYINWNKGQSIFEDSLPLIRVIELAGQPLFNHLQSLTISSSGSDNGIRRATVFFNLN